MNIELLLSACMEEILIERKVIGMKKFVLAFILFGFSAISLSGCKDGDSDNAQDGGPGEPEGPEGNPVAWAKSAGGDGYALDIGFAVAAIEDGTSFITGEVDCHTDEKGTIFGVGEENEILLEAGPRKEMFVARYNPNGTLAWARVEGTEEGTGIAAFADGSCVVAGKIGANSFFGEGEQNETPMIPAGSEDVFLSRYDPEGKLSWAVTAGGSGWDEATDVATMNDGTILATGVFQGTATFGSGESNETLLTASGEYGVFVAKYSGGGEPIWAKKISVESDQWWSSRISPHEDGSFSLVGTFKGDAVLGEGEENETAISTIDLEGDMFIARYNSAGELLWARTAVGHGYNQYHGVAASEDRTTLVLGSFDHTITVEGAQGDVTSDAGQGDAGEGDSSELTSEGYDDFFVAKYSAEGDLMWLKQGGGPDEDVAMDIAATPDGDFCIVGRFKFLIYFGHHEEGELELHGDNWPDIFVAKYNKNGVPIWARSSGGGGTEYGNGAAIIPDGSVYATGFYRGTANFDVGDENPVTLTSSGNEEIFVMRLLP
jgi:hypothetical protein